MVQIFFDRIRYRIRLEGFKSVRIRVRIFNTRYHIRIRILKSHIYDVDIQSYPIRHGWHYPYLNSNLDRNIKTNVILVVSDPFSSLGVCTYGTEVCSVYKRILMHVSRPWNINFHTHMRALTQTHTRKHGRTHHTHTKSCLLITFLVLTYTYVEKEVSYPTHC